MRTEAPWIFFPSWGYGSHMQVDAESLTVDSQLDSNNPENVGLPGTRNFYLQTDKFVFIGLWHILPGSLSHSAPEGDSDLREKWFQAQLKNDRPIVLYLHGNKGSRGGSHRVELYNKLRQLDYHVIAIDYRDSSAGDPLEEELVMDAKAVFSYLLDFAGTSPIFVWGHSLGTGVSCHAVLELCRRKRCPRGLILEAPFNNLHDEIQRNPLSQIFHPLPYFDWAFIDSVKDTGYAFESDKHIADITCPILILHAQDDYIIPIELGRKLYRAAQYRQQAENFPTRFIEFKAMYGYGHNHISRAPEFTEIIRNFVKNSTAASKTQHSQ
ncbi:Lysophosphatidylserine lipase ABHD12-like 1 [Homarus americanus]|uniref:Lysophosphatidylserine lipase ABHD12-like 1 n=1 Tax=Homarus americanus TaxID=6706 RepID=A0A8J5N7B6_HOMAM|nr:Lysophosphatidylserine lipase ABHD12-like 1 [Homarus americanus]